MKIAVLGAGALGSAIGGTLSRAGHVVTLINRNRDHVVAINTDGLRMRSAEGEVTVQAHAAVDAKGLGPQDLVIVLVKSFQTREAIRGAMTLVGPETVVMSLQNGLGHEEVLAELVGRERLLAGKTYVGGVLLGPGQVLVGVAGKETLIGELDGRLSPRALAIGEAFNAAGLVTTVSDNILGLIWDKLLVNVATGAVAAITRLTYGPLYEVHEIEETAIAAVREAMQVARACGIPLTTTEARSAWIRASTGLPADFKTSMLQSLEKGSVTEIDFINGAVVRWGERHRIPTPVNRTLTACIKGIERAASLAQETSVTYLTPSPETQPAAGRAYVEHVALRVSDIHWHIRFFREVLGMEMREVAGSPDDPSQYWTVGGIQLMASPGLQTTPTNNEGRLAHLGVMVENLDAALLAAGAWGVSKLPQGFNWIQLPDGLALELIQAAPGSVDQALAVDPRA